MNILKLLNDFESRQISIFNDYGLLRILLFYDIFILMFFFACAKKNPKSTPENEYSPFSGKEV